MVHCIIKLFALNQAVITLKIILLQDARKGMNYCVVSMYRIECIRKGPTIQVVAVVDHFPSTSSTDELE